MTCTYFLQSREEDESKQGMPTLQFVNADDKESWLRITGDELFRLDRRKSLHHVAVASHANSAQHLDFQLRHFVVVILEFFDHRSVLVSVGLNAAPA